MAKVKMIGLYGMDGTDAYYRKQGIYCYDLVSDEDLATELTDEEAHKITEGKAYYLKQFAGKDMVII